MWYAPLMKFFSSIDKRVSRLVRSGARPSGTLRCQISHAITQNDPFILCSFQFCIFRQFLYRFDYRAFEPGFGRWVSDKS